MSSNAYNVVIEVRAKTKDAVAQIEAVNAALLKQFKTMAMANKTMASTKFGAKINVKDIDDQVKATNRLSAAQYRNAQSAQKLAHQHGLLQAIYLKNSDAVNKKYLTSMEGFRLLQKRLNDEFAHTIVRSKGVIRQLDDVGLAAERSAIKHDLAARRIINVGHKIVDQGKNFQWTGRQLMVGLTAPLVGLGTVAVKSYLDWDKAIIRNEKLLEGSTLKVKNDSKALQEHATVLSQGAKGIKGYGKSRVEIAAVQNQFAALGLSIEQIKKLTTETLNLDILGDIENLEASGKTVSVLFKNLNGDIGKVRETLALFNYVEDETNLQMRNLVEGFEKIFPTMNRFNFTATQTTALLAAITQGGFEVGEAARAIRTLFTRIPAASAFSNTGETANRLKGLREQIDAWNASNPDAVINFFDKAGNLNGPEAFLGLAKAWGKMGDLRKTMFASLGLGADQSARLGQLLDVVSASLSQNTDFTRDFITAWNAAEHQLDATARASQQVAKVLGSDSNEVQTRIQGILNTAQDIGKSLIEPLKGFLDAIKGVIDFIKNLPDGVKKFLGLFAGGLAILGPMIYGFGLLKIVLGQVIAAFGHFKKSMNGLRIGMEDLGNEHAGIINHLQELRTELDAGAIQWDEYRQHVKNAYEEINMRRGLGQMGFNMGTHPLGGGIAEGITRADISNMAKTMAQSMFVGLKAVDPNSKAGKASIRMDRDNIAAGIWQQVRTGQGDLANNPLHRSINDTLVKKNQLIAVQSMVDDYIKIFDVKEKVDIGQLQRFVALTDKAGIKGSLLERVAMATGTGKHSVLEPLRRAGGTLDGAAIPGLGVSAAMQLIFKAKNTGGGRIPTFGQGFLDSINPALKNTGNAENEAAISRESVLADLKKEEQALKRLGTAKRKADIVLRKNAKQLRMFRQGVVSFDELTKELQNAMRTTVTPFQPSTAAGKKFYGFGARQARATRMIQSDVGSAFLHQQGFDTRNQDMLKSLSIATTSQNRRSVEGIVSERVAKKIGRAKDRELAKALGIQELSEDTHEKQRQIVEAASKQGRLALKQLKIKPEQGSLRTAGGRTMKGDKSMFTAKGEVSASTKRLIDAGFQQSMNTLNQMKAPKEFWDLVSYRVFGGGNAKQIDEILSLKIKNATQRQGLNAAIARAAEIMAKRMNATAAEVARFAADSLALSDDARLARAGGLTGLVDLNTKADADTRRSDSTKRPTEDAAMRALEEQRIRVQAAQELEKQLQQLDDETNKTLTGKVNRAAMARAKKNAAEAAAVLETENKKYLQMFSNEIERRLMADRAAYGKQDFMRRMFMGGPKRDMSAADIQARMSLHADDIQYGEAYRPMGLRETFQEKRRLARIDRVQGNRAAMRGLTIPFLGLQGAMPFAGVDLANKGEASKFLRQYGSTGAAAMTEGQRKRFSRVGRDVLGDKAAEFYEFKKPSSRALSVMKKGGQKFFDSLIENYHPSVLARKGAGGAKGFLGGIGRKASGMGNAVSGKMGKAGMASMMMPGGEAIGSTMQMVSMMGPWFALAAGAAFLLWKNWDKVKDSISTGIKKIKGGIESLINAVAGPFIGMFERITGSSKKGGDGVTNIWKTVGKVLGGVLHGIGIAFGIVAKIAKPIFEGIATVIGFVVKIVMGFISLFKLDFGEALKHFGGAFAIVFDFIRGIAATVIGGIVKAMLAIPRLWLNMVGKMLRPFANAPIVGRIVKPLLSGLESANNGLKKFGEGVEDVIRGRENISSKNKLKIPEFNKKDARKKGEEAGEEAGKGTQDALDDTEIEMPEPDTSNLDKVKDFISAFQGQLSDMNNKWKDAIMSSFEDYARQHIKTIEDAHQARIKVFDDEMKMMDLEEKRLREEDQLRDYLTNKEEMRKKKLSAQTIYRRERDLAIYEGRYDDAKILDLNHAQDMEQIVRDEAELERNRGQQLLDIEREAKRQLLEEKKQGVEKELDGAKDLAEKELELRRTGLQNQVDEILRFIPQNVAAANAQQAALLKALSDHTGGYGTIGASQAASWGVGWQNAFNNAKTEVEKQAWWAGKEAANQFARALGIDPATLEGGGGGFTASAPTPVKHDPMYGDPFASGGQINGSTYGDPFAYGAPTNVRRGAANPMDASRYVVRYHSGGPIGSTSQAPSDVPATLQTGEYVVQRSAVSKLGTGVLDMLNSGKAVFHSGGMVEGAKAMVANKFGRAYQGFMAGTNAIGGITREMAQNSIMERAMASMSFYGAEGSIPGAFGKLVSTLSPGMMQVARIVFGAIKDAIITSTTGGKHTKGSYHYRKPGQAIDFDMIPNSRNSELFSLLLPLAQRGVLAELFYDPLGGWKNGKSIGAIGGHSNHVHAAIANAFANGFSGGGGSTAAFGGPGSPKDKARQMLGAYGWGPGQFAPLDNLIQRESGWRPNAANPTSSARGMFQFLKTTWQNYITNKGGPPYWNTDVDWQLRGGFDYIKSRYGTPSNAMDFWNRNHWYHKGGFVMPNIPKLDTGGMIARSGIAEVHRGERVLNRQETESLGGEFNLNLHFDGGYFGSNRELEKLVDTIEKRVLPKINRQKGVSTRKISKI